MADIAIFRINYKSDFILTLQSDAGWLTPFCIKFWTGAPSQAYFAGYDGTIYTHCAPVEGDPTKLRVQFDDHHLPIGDLKFQIGYHFTVADFHTSVEDEVINQASVIIEVDNAPAQVMLDFTGETAPEIHFSLPAYANEVQRIANEQQRIVNEQQRIQNEETRIQHEESRIAAEQTSQQKEQQRINQEQARVNEYASLKADAVAATVAANDAAALANQKAQLAADKAALAQSFANLANAKALLAADKAALAASAAQLANDKAALAQQKAEYAQQQGGYAKDQGDYAKEQGNTALADHQRAEADHGVAVDDHTQAGNDHTRAEADHGVAVDDHTQAGNDHTRAESDHGIAVDDHTQAGNDHTRAESDHGIAADDHTQAGNDHTRAESDHTRAESDHDAVELYIDSLGVFDLSKHNAVGGVLATYADLSAALTALNALESKYKYGGMSFKFVQSSDNKYVQYRCIAGEFTTDVTQWAIADEGVYVENPEFIYVKTDAEGKILWAIKIDGSIYYGAGVPQQIVDYINKKIADLSLDEYEDIVAFLNGLEEGDKTLQTLLNEKVDKEESKSLIDVEYASTKSTIDNPEFLEVTTDSEDKVLEGIQQDGTKVIGGDIKVLGNMKVSGVSYKVIENPEYLAAWLDAEDKVIFGLKNDGKTYVGDADFLDDIKNNQEAINEIKSYLSNFDSLDIDALTSITAVENPEFIDVETDSEGKILSSRDNNGVKKEYVGFETPKVSIDGHTIENIEDIEGRNEITTDSEDKVISYRDFDGVKHEEVGIYTSDISLSEEGLLKLKRNLLSIGNSGDWSDYKSNDGDAPLNIALPRCAVVNIDASNFSMYQLSKEGMDGAVEKVNYNIPTTLEFWDNNGNYFKKQVLISGQGQSTLMHLKKAMSIDFFDGSVYNSKGKFGKGDVFSIKFGDWVAQDSYHLKSYYTDPLRCKGPVCYRVYNDMLKSWGIFKDYPWKRGLIDVSSITLNDNGIDSSKDIMTQFESGARCVPDGFPVILYVNGKFFGLYDWQLKKHRDNYKLNKSNSNHVWIDSSAIHIWNMDGNLDWEQLIADKLEIRNPKDLYVMNSDSEIVKYNLDTGNVGELIDDTMPGFDSNNPDHVRSMEVKEVLVNMSKIMPELNALADTYENYRTPENLASFKNKFEEYFDVENLCDYQIISQFIRHWDNWGNNWQWITYDGKKWYVTPYDCDQTFRATPLNYLDGRDKYMFELLIKYYKHELVERYTFLKQEGILSVDNTVKHFKEFLEAWGADYYKLEMDRWLREGSLSDTSVADTLLRVARFVEANLAIMDTLYIEDN